MLGWIFMRTLDSTSEMNHPQQNQVTNFYRFMKADLIDDLNKFWELEKLSMNRIFTPGKQLCEDLFKSTHTWAITQQGFLQSKMR